LNSVSRQIGRVPAGVMWYEAWSDGPFGSQHQARLDGRQEHGITPMISW